MRKNAETEMQEAASRLSDLNMIIQQLTNDKRKLEADLSALQADIDDAHSGRQVTIFPVLTLRSREYSVL